MEIRRRLARVCVGLLVGLGTLSVGAGTAFAGGGGGCQFCHDNKDRPTLPAPPSEPVDDNNGGQGTTTTRCTSGGDCMTTFMDPGPGVEERPGVWY